MLLLEEEPKGQTWQPNSELYLKMFIILEEEKWIKSKLVSKFVMSQDHERKKFDEMQEPRLSWDEMRSDAIMIDQGSPGIGDRDWGRF